MVEIVQHMKTAVDQVESLSDTAKTMIIGFSDVDKASRYISLPSKRKIDPHNERMSEHISTKGEICDEIVDNVDPFSEPATSCNVLQHFPRPCNDFITFITSVSLIAPYSSIPYCPITN